MLIKGSTVAITGGGRGIGRDQARQFVGMYVNDWTLDFGPRGREAVGGGARRHPRLRRLAHQFTIALLLFEFPEDLLFRARSHAAMRERAVLQCGHRPRRPVPFDTTPSRVVGRQVLPTVREFASINPATVLIEHVPTPDLTEPSVRSALEE